MVGRAPEVGKPLWVSHRSGVFVPDDVGINHAVVQRRRTIYKVYAAALGAYARLELVGMLRLEMRYLWISLMDFADNYF